MAAVAYASAEESSPFQNLRAFAEALHVVEVDYVRVVDQDSLVQGAMRGMLEQLDPHSDYLDPAEYARLRADSEGHFGGIGVEVVVRDGWLSVAGVFPGGAAAEEGIQAGDRFLAIENIPARDMRLRTAVELMRGEEGSEVQVVLRREGVSSDIALSLERRRIDIPPIEFSELPEGVAYLAIHAFQAGTAAAVEEVISQDREQPLRALLLDLRNNGGGLFREAVRVSDLFLREGAIVGTRARAQDSIRFVTATEDQVADAIPIVVLINAYTASAAEIVAAALSDRGRARLVGERSFGKGSVQSIVELSGGGALKLTTALYYSPDGVTIQARGVEPHFVVSSSVGQEGRTLREDGLERHLPAESNQRPRQGTRGVEGQLDTSPLETGDLLGGAVAVFSDDPAARGAYRLLLSAASEQP